MNRQYLNPSPELHPSIYAAKTLLLYHHTHTHSHTHSNSTPHTQLTPLNNKSANQPQPAALTPLEVSLNQRNAEKDANPLQAEVPIVTEENTWTAAETKKGDQNTSPDSSETVAPANEDVAAPQGEEPVPPQEGGVAYYVDLHGHASKRGCFMYGNNLPEESQQVKPMLLLVFEVFFEA